MKGKQVVDVVDRVLAGKEDQLSELSADEYKQLYREVIQEAKVIGEQLESGQLETGEPVASAAPEIPEEFRVYLQQWLDGGGTLAEFLELNRAELGGVAELEEATTMPNTSKAAVEPALYRNGLDRARAAAKSEYYPGLVSLVQQARRTGDTSLEQAAWDVADELDQKHPGQAWRETVTMGLGQ